LPDAGSFDTIAWNVASVGRYASLEGPTSYRTPPYVFFLALIYKMGGHHYLLARLAQALMGTALVWLLMRIACQLRWSGETRWMVGGIAAVYPFFVYYENQLIADAFITFWLVGSLSLTLYWKRHFSSGWRAASCAFAYSIVNLAKGIFAPIFFSILAMEFIFSLRERDRVRRWKAMGFALLIFTIFPFLWALRNKCVLGRFCIDTHGGRTAAITIIFHDALKSGSVDAIFVQHPMRKAADLLNEADQDAYYFAQVKQYIAHNPRLYAMQSLNRLKDLWRFYPRQDIEFRENRKLLTVVSLVTEPFLILAGFFGLWKERGRWRELYPFYAAILFTTASYALVTGQMRYRLPLMPIMILFASYAVFSSKNRTPDH